MRIWDVSPGYLNRQSLLGEHRELHGLVSIITNGKKGYSQHPETLRWVNFGWALRMRHQQLSAEMALRGYRDNTPVNLMTNTNKWPEEFIDTPAQQYALLINIATKSQAAFLYPQHHNNFGASINIQCSPATPKLTSTSAKC